MAPPSSAARLMKEIRYNSAEVFHATSDACLDVLSSQLELKTFVHLESAVVYEGSERCLWNICRNRGSVELRRRIHRNRSPLCNSPDRRDGKARQTSHGARHILPLSSVEFVFLFLLFCFAGDSSPEKRIDRNVRKRTRWDVRGDGSIDQIEDKAKMQIDDQLRETYAEIRRLEDDKQRLQMYLEDKDKEASSLTFEIHELEMQLSEEKKEGNRFKTKVKKFIEAHNCHLRLQDELKRSEAQLQNLVEHLDSDVGEGSEDDPNIKALRDDEGRLNSSSRVEVRETSPQVQRQR
ncbi:zinc finger CCCH domain-containing protein 40-like [Salvia splendens]|uniref:zinc finger CCCH domain-containing protein 40-like n=1 Tax=Salvia splendens TaxID=180675 RepID=UPI001C268AD4|nr:zinc finger CCCH domain-containing protein 40-like [Salvia splendens]